MDEPFTMRCKAATARRVIATVLLGYMSIAVPAYLIFNGGEDGVIALLLGGCLYVFIVGAAIGHAVGLRCRMELDAEGITFVGVLSDERFRWDEITAIEYNRDPRTWEVEVVAGERRVRPGALKCLKWGLRPPRSLRACVEEIERRRVRPTA